MVPAAPTCPHCSTPLDPPGVAVCANCGFYLIPRPFDPGGPDVESVDPLDGIAGMYTEELEHRVYHQRGGRTNRAAVVRLLPPDRFNRPRVLDLGCGDGSVAQALHDAGRSWESYTGIDGTPQLVELFDRRTLPETELRLGDATDLVAAVPDGTVDVVLCLFMLQHLSEERGTQFLQEVSRVLVPRGVLLIGLAVVPGGDSVAYIGERGYRDKKTRRWNWGEVALGRRLAQLGLSEVDRHADPNPNGVVTELYLLATRGNAEPGIGPDRV